MDTGTIISTVIGAIAALAGSFGAQLIANSSSKKTKDKERLDEISLLLVQIKEWLDFEVESNLLAYEHDAIPMRKNPHEYPTYKLLALTMNGPYLGEIAKKISKEVHYINNAELFEFIAGGVPPEEILWREYVKPSCDKIEKCYNDAFLIIANKNHATRNIRSILMKPFQSSRTKSIQGATNKATP